MQHPGLSLVEAYWEGLRAGRLVPRRADVDPRGIDQALEYSFILERIAPGMARFRLAGMHLN
ncbi:MAG: PAS domain-containing protein, partial [Pseudomonadota bacterium]